MQRRLAFDVGSSHSRQMGRLSHKSIIWVAVARAAIAS